MAQLVVRNLEERVKAGLLRRAKRNRRSMEEEVRTILRKSVLNEETPQAPLGSRLKRRFEGIGLTRPIPALRGGKPRAALFEVDE
jgi:plasmid stability protein